jgi:protein-tyrosine phosphatase
LSIDIRDQEHANLFFLSCIPSSNIFIEAGMDAGGILVHCYGGRSRSVAFVAAFLMSCCGWSFDYDINIIKAARPAASINPGFEAQLRAYAQTNYDVYAAQQVLLQSRLRALKQLRVF